MGVVERDDNRLPIPIPFDLWMAQQIIENSYGDKVSIYQKLKTLRKFGRNNDVGSSFETVWITGGDETYLTSNAIVNVTSTDGGDDQDIVIEGHTIANGELTFYSSAVAGETITLDGTNNVTLPTPLARVNRLYNDDTSDFAGTITVEESGGTAHLTVTEGNQSEKAATSISVNDYYIITEAQFFVFNKTIEYVEFIGEFRQVASTPKAWRRVFSTVASNAGAYVEVFSPPFIIPKNHDIRVRAKSDGTGTVEVGASFNGYLASIIT